MKGLATDATAALALAGLVVGLAAVVTQRQLQPGLGAFLDLLLAAGLLRLAAADTWTAIGTAAAVVVVRRVAGYGLGVTAGPRGARRRGRPSYRSGGSSPT